MVHTQHDDRALILVDLMDDSVRTAATSPRMATSIIDPPSVTPLLRVAIRPQEIGLRVGKE